MPTASETGPAASGRRPTAEAERRGCYCVEGGRNDDLPEGYCGRCELCGKPGHTRHHPGPVPVTGAWCDRHYRMVTLLHPLTPVGKYVWLSVLAACAITYALVFR